MPIGGIVGVGIGWIDGGTMGQMVGGQIGRISIALLHTGCITPFMQTHAHVASASDGNAMAMMTAAAGRNLRM